MITNKEHEKYAAMIEEKIFSEFDKDRNGMFTRREFPKIIKMITDLLGADIPTEDDVEDIFNLLDINGDETVDRVEFTSLIRTLFKVLEEQDISIKIAKESDMIL